jgi:hypothetical protein
MKLYHETDEKQAGMVEETAPDAPVTLESALAEMNPSLAVEPVADTTPIEDTAESSETAPGDEGEYEEEAAELAVTEEEPELLDEEAEEVEEVEEEPQVEAEGDTFKLTVGDVEIELEADDETREALEKMQNDLGRVSDIDQMFDRVKDQHQQNMQDRASLEAIEEDLRVDPVGYISERVHPDIKKQLLKEMLYDDDLLQVAEDYIGRWLDDPASRREEAATLRVERVERKQRMSQERERLAEQRREAQAIWDKVMEITPADMDHTEAKMWHRDALVDIQQYVAANKIERLDPEMVPQVLAARMRLYGIGTNVRRKPAQPASDTADVTADSAGEKFRKKVARRRRVASAPTGAGGAPGRTQLPKGATLDDALAALKKRVGQ